MFSEANALKQALSGMSHDIDQTIKKLSDCQNRACTQIPAADKQYAFQTNQLVQSVNQLKEAVFQIRNFLVSIPFTMNAEDFHVAFEVARNLYNGLSHRVAKETE